MTTYTWYNKAQVDSLLTPITSQAATTNSTVSANAGAQIAASLSGVVASGADVSSSLTSLLAGITTYTVVRLPPGTINLGSTSYSIDVSKVAFVGDRTILSGTGTITLFSTANYYNRQTNWGPALFGVTLSGMNLAIGSTTHDTNAMFRLVDGGMSGGALTFIANAWKIHFQQFNMTGTAISMPAATVNSGENMVWRDSLLGDGTTLNLGTGDWHFDGCSFDNMRVSLSGGVVVHMDGPHFEASGGTSARLLSLTGAGTACTITGGILVIDAGTGNWIEAPFYVDPAIVRGGLSVRGMQVPLQPYFVPETTDLLRILVAGGGTARFGDISTFEGSTPAYALSETQNAIRNGGCEENSSAGWTMLNTGTWSADAAIKNRGSYSHKLSCSVGQTLQFYQDFTVNPGGMIWAQWWQKFTPVAGGTVSFQLYFYDRSGAQVSTTDYSQFTTSATQYLALIRPVPAGAAYGRAYFYQVAGSSGVTTLNLDDFIVNLA